MHFAQEIWCVFLINSRQGGNMPTKKKSSKQKKAPVAKKKAVRKSAPKTTADLLAKQVQQLSNRLKILENSPKTPGPAGKQGPPGPKGDPADLARIEELERRITELERRLVSHQHSLPDDNFEDDLEP
jgi:hypothetical protein